MTWDAFEFALTYPPLPELLGLTELAKQLGVSRQRVAQLSARDDFPKPAQRLAAGPVWAKPAVDRFAAGWERKRTGRPRKEQLVDS